MTPEITVNDLLRFGHITDFEIAACKGDLTRERSAHRFVKVLTVARQLAAKNISVHTFTGSGYTMDDAEKSVLANYKTNARVALGIPAHIQCVTLDAETLHGIQTQINKCWVDCTANVNGFSLKE